MDMQYLKKYLEDGTASNISLVITDNSTSMLSIRKRGNFFMMRLHRIFLSAGKEVLNEMAEFIKDTKAKTPYIRKFINQNKHFLKTKPRRTVNIKTQGRYNDLLYIYNSLNGEYFKGNISAFITWGKGGPKLRVRKRTLGSFNINNNMIRINPLLDNKKVPQYFLEFVVYHEMLHADMGVAVNSVCEPERLLSSPRIHAAGLSNRAKGSRRTVHSKEFKKRETLFKHYHRAMEWEKKMWG
jgi:hypothetical protein